MLKDLFVLGAIVLVAIILATAVIFIGVMFVEVAKNNWPIYLYLGFLVAVVSLTLKDIFFWHMRINRVKSTDFSSTEKDMSF